LLITYVSLFTFFYVSLAMLSVYGSYSSTIVSPELCFYVYVCMYVYMYTRACAHARTDMQNKI